jgi:hypothetical protein
MTNNELPAWIVGRIFVLELLASRMLCLYLSSLRNVPTAEEATARLEAFRESGLRGAAVLPDDLRDAATAYLNDLLDTVATDIRLGRSAALSADAISPNHGLMQ